VTSSSTTEPTAGGAGGSRKPLIIVALVAGLVVVLGVISLVVNHGGSSSGSLTSSTAKTGDPVPHFSLPKLSAAGSVRVPQDGGGRGKAAVLVFFASWCGPCRKEMPSLAEAVKKGEAGKAAVLGIDGSDGIAAATAFVTKTGMSFPVGVDSAYAVTSGRFGFVGLPETVFVNARGIITEIHYGATTPALLRQGVANMGAR
jgi:thiol-disulfide isomerase/thioredoxin